MQTNYLIILNYASSEVITIALSKEQKEKAKRYADFEKYVATLEKKYHFRLNDCSWMVSSQLHERKYL